MSQKGVSAKELLGIPFSTEQEVAFSAEPKPASIIAAAGSGKTTVMGARVVHLVVSHGYKPSEILGITFTNLATKELMQVVSDAVGKIAATGFFAEELFEDELIPNISTYHSFAQQIVRGYGLRIGIESDLQAVADVRQRQLCARVLRNFEMSSEIVKLGFAGAIDAVLELDSQMSNFDVSKQALQDFDQKIVDSFASQLPADAPSDDILRRMLTTSQTRIDLVRAVEAFRTEKRIAGIIDYADMTRYALEIVRKCPDVVQNLRLQYKAVLLDEYQDTSIAQRELMRLTFGESHPVTAVGDPMQCIFSFQGAHPANMSLFSSHFAHRTDTGLQSPKDFPMLTTRRNGKHIISLANSIVEPLQDPENPLKLSPPEQPPFGDGYVRIASFATADEEASWIAEKMRDLHANGVAYDDMAVLLRKNRDVNWFFHKLNELGIPAQMRNKTGLLQVPEIMEVVSVLRAMAEPESNVAWLRLLTNSRWRIGARDIVALADLAQKLQPFSPSEVSHSIDADLSRAVESQDDIDKIAYGDAIEAIAEGAETSKLSDIAVSRLKALHKEITFLRGFTHLPIGELVYLVVKVTGLAVEVSAHSNRVERGMAANLRHLMKIAAEFVSIDQDNSLFAFLDWLKDADRYQQHMEISAPAQKGAVMVLTVHSSKGMQFRMVALPRMGDRNFPDTQAPDYWPTDSAQVPIPLKNDEQQTGILKEFPNFSAPWELAEFERYKQAMTDQRDLDERRLLYVGVTRTKDVLYISTSAMRAGEKTARKPSPFWQELRQIAIDAIGSEVVVGSIDEVAAALVAEIPATPWPFVPNSSALTSTAELAALVNQANGFHPHPALTEIDLAIEVLESELKARSQLDREVVLPNSLSVSQLMKLNADEDSYLLDLIRPMPFPPTPAAARGTAFHAWVEARGRKLMGPGIAQTFGFEDEMEPITDFGPLDPNLLKKHQATFEASEWGARKPYRVEEPFAFPIGGRVLSGRIDAVFKDDDTYTVVDWKTNSEQDADFLQLSIYRLALAHSYGIPAEQIRAAFYYVASDSTVWLENPITAAEVEQLLSA